MIPRTAADLPETASRTSCKVCQTGGVRMTKTKYVCNECDKKTGADYGPCVLKVPFDSFPPEFCPYDGKQINWQKVRK